MERDSTLLHHPSPPSGGHSIPVGLPDERLPSSEYGDKLRAALCPGRVISTENGPYLILKILGQGGTAIAILTTPLQLARFKGRRVNLADFQKFGLYKFVEGEDAILRHWMQFRSALRVLKIALARPGEDQHRIIWESMVRELDCSETMERPAMPIVYGAGLDPVLHLVLEYIQGDTLAQIFTARFRNGRFVPFSWKQVYGFMHPMADAVAHLHKNNIAHCDLKPENTIVHQRPGSDEVEYLRLLDPGFARYVPSASLTDLIQRGLVKGPLEKTVAAYGLTPTHAAPEQLSGHPVSTATDLYALGGILYELLTGALPFWQGSTAELYTPAGLLKLHDNMRRGTFPPVQHQEFPERAKSTQALNGLLSTALKFEPGDRLWTAKGFAETLDEISRLRLQERRGPGVHRPTIRYRILKAGRIKRAESNRRIMRVWGMRILLVILIAALALFAAPHLRQGCQSALQRLEKVTSVENAPASPPSAPSTPL